MPDETASAGTQALQPRQSFPDQRAADPPALVFRQYRHRPESVPVPGTVGHRHWGEGDVSHYAPIHFRHEGDRERFAGAQGGDDELLRMITDGQRLECRGCHLGDGGDIGAGFKANTNLVFHVWRSSFLEL
jgi:hypothetical protein